MSTTTDTANLKPYRKANTTQIPDNDKTYLSRELDKIEALLSRLVTIAKSHDTRLQALEP